MGRGIDNKFCYVSYLLSPLGVEWHSDKVYGEVEKRPVDGKGLEGFLAGDRAL